MGAWTEEEVLANGRKYLDEQARERKRVAGELNQALGAFAKVNSTPIDRTTSEVLAKPRRREGRIKGVAPVTDRTYDGRVYHSKAEMNAAMQLDFQLRAGLIRRWTPQVPYPIIVNGVRVCKVVIDFEVEALDGLIEAIEVKGHETELYRLKAKLLKACYPRLAYKVVKA